MITPDIEIMDTMPEHLRMMAMVMDEQSAMTALKLGMSPNKALWRSWKNSIYCKTAFINGNIAAIWGLAALCFSDTAFPWLILTPEVAEYPMRVAFVYRRELEKMLSLFPQLEDYVPEDNEKAIRLLELMGFHIGKESIKRGDMVFRHAVRRAV